MELNYNYSDCIKRCRELSSYEGGQAVDANGESKYLDIKIAVQDEPLILTFLQQGAHLVEDNLGRCVLSSSFTVGGFGYELKEYTDKWHTDDTLKKEIFECVCTFAMKMWLAYHSNARSDAYDGVLTSLLGSVVRNAYRKTAPKKQKRERPNMYNTVEVVTE